MEMKKSRLLLVPLLLAAVAALAAGCGGGSSSASVPADSVATVGSDHITKAQFNVVLGAAKNSFKQQSQKFPALGTPQYNQVRDQVVTWLVQQDELTQGAKQIGVTISQQDVNKGLDQLKQRYFKGNEKKWQQALKASGETLQQVELQIRAQVLGQKIYNKVTSGVTVSDAAVKKYYEKNQASYTTKASREVRHILVSSKSKAEKIESQLKHGASFAVLAKKYSTDTASAKNGGKLGPITQGEMVPPFDKAAFSLKTGEISPPVKSVYGWHIIQATSPVKPAHVTPFSQLQTQIRTSLLQQKKSAVMTAWSNKLKKQFTGKVHYQAGYQPAATTSSSGGATAPSGTTTTTP
jgi:foldase protein PrsA